MGEVSEEVQKIVSWDKLHWKIKPKRLIWKKYTSVHVIRKEREKGKEMHFAQDIRINYILKMNYQPEYFNTQLHYKLPTTGTSFWKNPLVNKELFRKVVCWWHAILCENVVQLLSRVQLFVTQWTAEHQDSLSFIISQSLLKLTSIESVMPSNHFILHRALLLLPSIFPSIRVFSDESTLWIRWPKYWSFSFSINLSNEYSGLISFRIDWFNLLAVQGTLESLLQHHSSKTSILWCSAVKTSLTSRVSKSAIRWENEKWDTRIQRKVRIRVPTLLQGEGA